MPPRTPVLIEVHADGYLEVYARKDVDVYFVDRPVANSPSAGTKVDEIVDLLIPRRYRELRWANLRRSYLPARTTAADLLLRLQLQAEWKALTKLGNIMRRGRSDD